MYTYPSYSFHLPSCSNALETAIDLFDEQLLPAIMEETIDEQTLMSLLRTLIDLNPFQLPGNTGLGFSWIAEILDTGYQEDARCRMTCEVVRALGKFFFLDFSPSIGVRPTQIPPILGFLSSCEKLGSPRWSLDPALTALRILSISPSSPNFDTEILPILTSTLLPTHPLRSRVLALDIFVEFTSSWFSPQMENVPGKALENLLQAVGDPLQFLDPPPQDGEPGTPPSYQPMVAAVVLIEFASSVLWWNHLRHSNFASCEEVASTLEGKRSIFWCMVDMLDVWPELLCTATKINTAIRCLEGVHCFNTAEVVIMWAWAIGAGNPVGRNEERLICRETLRFYQTHGARRLATLMQHINTANDNRLLERFYEQQCQGPPGPQARNDQRLTPTPHPQHRSLERTYFRLAQACQVRRLHHLFGYDRTMWKEEVEAGVEGEVDLLPGCSARPTPFLARACGYP